MNGENGLRIVVVTLGVITTAAIAFGASAADGPVLINQAAAAIGNVTPGDGPGFPVTISKSGSYRLSSNLVVENANTTAIEISSDDVVLDLNGFSIIGVCAGPVRSVGIALTNPCAGSRSTGIGIKAGTALTNASNGPVKDGHSNVTVFNGTVAGMGDTGIIAGPNAKILGVTVRSNVGDGILTGFSSIVKDCIVTGNGDTGVRVGGGSIASNNTLNLNGTGIHPYSPGAFPEYVVCLLIGNVAVANSVRNASGAHQAILVNNVGF